MCFKVTFEIIFLNVPCVLMCSPITHPSTLHEERCPCLYSAQQPLWGPQELRLSLQASVGGAQGQRLIRRFPADCRGLATSLRPLAPSQGVTCLLSFLWGLQVGKGPEAGRDEGVGGGRTWHLKILSFWGSPQGAQSSGC